MNHRKELLLIHHSHTDIGYTDRQEKITRYHVDFIKQAVAICEQIENGGMSEWAGFRWVCENTWQVEQFLANSTSEEQANFRKYVQRGWIDISGTYLNMTELIDIDILTAKLKRGLDAAERAGKRPVSAMTADVNGYAWGYADVMHQQGIRHLFSCIHTHHGMFPFNQKPMAFWWEAPSGQKLLTWVGEHYHFGNVLGCAPQGTTNESLEKAIEAHVRKVEAGLLRYKADLEAQAYSFPFIPLMVSGVMTDNAPPSGEIMAFVAEWNRSHRDTFPARMCSLDEFFELVSAHGSNLPSYRGDWNDWWADGVGSTMNAVKAFRDGQRTYQLAKKLDPEGMWASKLLQQEAEDKLMLYAEHTWGYSSSVSEPWNTLVNDLDLRKTAHAVNGTVAAAENLDRILAGKAEVSISANRDKAFRIINPHDIAVHDVVTIEIEYWEMVDGEPVNDVNVRRRLAVVDEKGNVLPSALNPISRAIEIEVEVGLSPREEKRVQLVLQQTSPAILSERHASMGAEGIRDVELATNTEKATVYELQNEFYHIVFDETTGIQDIVDRKDRTSLLHPQREHAPFAGIYEWTPIETSATDVRRKMGRNRKSVATKRYVSKLCNIEVKTKNKLYVEMLLSFTLEGTKMYQVVLKAYWHVPKLDVMVRFHKDSCWEPENLYIALPFMTGHEEEMWIEKTGCILRPGIDQLPYSNEAFYLIQDGAAYVAPKKTVHIAIKDVPLITLGSLKAKAVTLHESNPKLQNEPLYSWAMNNFWETNFKVDLSGFYEFQYTIWTTHEPIDAEGAIATCKRLNQGLIGYPSA
ncbi:glycosyl hydrolase [Aureibacillus halotolerans]|uniref:Glycosyl hydrolase family 38 n=1 Tax=Aureibacillus halotolerans TaxID=1508390 RepID=A0A4R6U852_9BACI|nr:glycosyl hydrolase [Aureibacillus halotolerans]TDQ41123.1 glycosyl hydrolase family 38 [Aureibacillus halotolerans]